MKLFVMTDMEGVAGVMNVDEYLAPDARYYETARRLLTRSVNAAVAGFADHGFDEILVADAHGWGAINLELLDERARLQRGWSQRLGGNWPFDMDGSFDALAFVGQHAKAGTEFSHITHTGWWDRLDVSINGISVGEYGELVLVAGEVGVPVIFASGEKALCEEAEDLTPWVVTAAVKEGTVGGSGEDLTAEQYKHFHEGAIHLAPAVAERLIRERADEAGRRFAADRESFSLVDVQPPYTVITHRRPYAGKPARMIKVEGAQTLAEALNSPGI